MSREAMQMALEALELLARYENPSTKIQVRKPKDGGLIVTMYPHKVATEAAAALREMLAQPEQDPVAEIQTEDMGKPFNAIRVTAHFYAEVPAVGTKLYKAPPKRDLTCVCGAVWDGEMMVHPPKRREWVGLTDEEIGEVISGQFAERNYWVKITKALESKLKEKNT